MQKPRETRTPFLPTGPKRSAGHPAGLSRNDLSGTGYCRSLLQMDRSQLRWMHILRKAMQLLHHVFFDCHCLSIQFLIRPRQAPLIVPMCYRPDAHEPHLLISGQWGYHEFQGGVDWA